MAKKVKPGPKPPEPDDQWLLRMECELLESGILLDEPLHAQQPGADPPGRFTLVARDDGHLVAANFAKEMTEAQVQHGVGLIRASDIRPRRARSRDDLAAALEVWAGNDTAKVAKLAALALADVLYDRPLYARRRGIPIDGEELPPTN